MAYADHSIAMPLRATKTFDRPGTGRITLSIPALRTGLLSQGPYGTCRTSLGEDAL
jgi:hypothetical protein